MKPQTIKYAVTLSVAIIAIPLSPERESGHSMYELAVELGMEMVLVVPNAERRPVIERD